MKITLTLCLNFLFVTSFFAQNSVENISMRDLKNLDVTFLIENTKLDANTALLETTVLRKSFYKTVLFVAEYDDVQKVINYKELETSTFEHHKSKGSTYLKLEDKIFRLRIEKDKGSGSLHLDELVNLDFKKNEKPFFTGSETEFGKYCEIVPNFTKTSFLVLTHDGGGETYPEQVVGRETHAVHEFSYSDLSLVSKDKVTFNKKEKYVNRDSKNLNGIHYASYNFFNSELKQWESKLLVYSDGKIKEVVIPTDKNKYVSSLNFYAYEDNLYVVSLQRTESLVFTLSLFKVTSDSKIELISSSKLNSNELFKEHFKSEIELKEQYLITFIFGKMVVDPKTKDIYLFHFKYFSQFDVGEIYVNNFTDELDAADLLITKISNNEIGWSSLVKRSLKHFRVYAPTPEIEFTENGFSFNDHELESLFDENGQFLPGVLRVRGKIVPISVEVNKETGEFKRKIIK